MQPPGKPKIGVVSVGHDGVHRGFGYKNAVIDDYPIRFGVRRIEKPKPPRPGAKYGRKP